MSSANSSTSSFKLSNFSKDSDISGHESVHKEETSDLAPVDGGAQAWTFVLCSFLLESFVWGLPFSYGVFQQWYLSNPPFDGTSEANINAIGTVGLGILYMEGIFLAFVFQRFPQWLRPMMVGGLVVCVFSLLISSFATKVWHLVVLQGVVYGTASGCLYMPAIFWLPEWFDARRSFASAFIFSGGGLGGTTFPLAANYLLERVGFRWTIRINALIVAIFGGVAIIGVKPRLPIPPVSSRKTTPAADLSFLKSPVFISVGITIFLQGLAYFPVAIYIPTYTVALGHSSLSGALVLAVFNMATVVGQIICGFYCSDYGPYTHVMLFSAILSCVMAYALWGFAHSLALVFVFVVMFGMISGGFSAIWTPAAAEVHASQPWPPFAFFGAWKGLAAIFGPNIAAVLHRDRINGSSAAHSGAGQGGWGGYGFTAIIIFVGSMMAAAAAGSVISSFLRVHKTRTESTAGKGKSRRHARLSLFEYSDEV
ncbi:MFS general substrate transporter [Auriscalpium vulgare]|uniref:MFS general substrate transporter n=1 Tax=Auriscalpium vulgare TaxID=40419 RepID=A0ACB8RFQ1_9AGAM|nr:MFS general substrate transporter [Auriscalpium vulgare]